jgi:RNA polymerase-binding transcription factor DksA
MPLRMRWEFLRTFAPLGSKRRGGSDKKREATDHGSCHDGTMITPHPTSETSTGESAPDPRWNWHFRTLINLRNRLLKAHAEHGESAADRAELHSVDVADIAEDRIEHHVLLAELHAEADRLSEIEGALTRIRNGTYGVCEVTGEPISEARLRAIPWTRFSIGAAERAELQLLPPSKRPRRRVAGA